MKKISNLIVSFLIITLPDLAHAQVRPINRIFTEGIIPEPTGPHETFEIIDVFTLLGNVLTLIFTFTAVVAVIYVIIGGYNYVMAYGNPETIQKGKQTITWAIIGLIVSVAAWAIVQFVWGTIAGQPPPAPATQNQNTTRPQQPPPLEETNPSSPEGTDGGFSEGGGDGGGGGGGGAR